jgi:hypothetical protein
MNTAITIAFAGAWIASGVAIVAWVIAAYSLLRFLPQRDPEYGSRALKAGAVFCVCVLYAALVTLIGFWLSHWLSK